MLMIIMNDNEDHNNNDDETFTDICCDSIKFQFLCFITCEIANLLNESGLSQFNFQIRRR